MIARHSRAVDRSWEGSFVDDVEFKYLHDNHLVDPVSCGVELTSTSAIVTSTWTTIEWDTAPWQYPSGWWTSTTSTTKQRLYTPYDGYYLVRLKWGWSSYSTTGARRARIYRETAGTYWEANRHAPNNGWNFGDVHYAGWFDAGDYVRASVYHTHGSNHNLSSDVKMEVYRLGV